MLNPKLSEDFMKQDLLNEKESLRREIEIAYKMYMAIFEPARKRKDEINAELTQDICPVDLMCDGTIYRVANIDMNQDTPIGMKMIKNYSHFVFSSGEVLPAGNDCPWLHFREYSESGYMDIAVFNGDVVSAMERYNKPRGKK